MRESLFPAHINDIGQVQTCTDHCRKVALGTSARLESIGLVNAGYLAGLIHDSGKFTEEFREYIERASSGQDARRGSVIHTFAAVRLLSKFFENTERPDMDRFASELVAVAAASHHGFFDCYDGERLSGINYRLKKQPEIDSRAIRAFYEECASEREIEAFFDKAKGEITRVLEKIHCVVQNTDVFFHLALLTRLISSALIDADRDDTAMFMSGKSQSGIKADMRLWGDCLSAINSYLDRFPTNTQIQVARREFSEECFRSAEYPPGVYRLDLPTGAGKTLSSLRFALRHAEEHGMRRIFLISPLLTILDQNAPAVKMALGRDDIILEHHSDVVRISDKGEDAQKYEYLTETWDAPVIITTLVRFLDTLFAGQTTSIRRFHALSGSVIVLDEVQSVPSKMLSLFNIAIDFLKTVCGCTVLLCSATQPEFGETAHPMHIDSGSIVSESTLKKHSAAFERCLITDGGIMNMDELAIFITSLDTNSILVVCNKKDEARELYDRLGDTDVHLFHLSADMCMAHRKDVLGEVYKALGSGEKVICVSTQVIEAGVDISFGAVIRLKAGLDSIVQSAGRCNRNGELTERAPVYIVELAGEGLSKLKDIKAGKDAVNSLLFRFRKDPDEFGGDLASDKSVSYYYKTLYGNMASDAMDYPVPGFPSIFSMLSDNRQWRDPAGRYHMWQAFRTAGDLFKVFDDSQISAVVPYKKGREVIDALRASDRDRVPLYKVRKLVESAKPYCVSLFSFQLASLIELGLAVELFEGTLVVLDERVYSNETGLRSIKEVEKECSILIS